MSQDFLQIFIDNYRIKLKETYRNCDMYRLSEYNAAVKIQAWFRGIRIRCYLKLLEKCTIIIQKTWRGYLGRKYYRRKLSEVVIEYRHNKFSRAAAKIQSAWKGYLTRKYVFNFYSRKIYLSALVDIGEFVINQLSEYEKEMKYLKCKENEENERKRIINWAKSHHFLVSTYCQPGIYQNAINRGLSDKETLLLSVRQELIKDEKSMNTKKKKKKKKTKTNDIENKTKSSIEQKSPFKPPDEVKKWMNTPLNLSLRVSTDYFSLEKAKQSWKSEEWNNRLHDNYFYTGQPSSLPHEGLLWTKSVYGSIPYGTKHFRMSEDENHSIQPRFRNVLPPIALFDRFNKEYIPGYATG
ncbi:Spermatogenesis-associated protein [Schistosoma japonicum]|uniref:Spermatogenesis-associated protein n=1 Tax=Schistosoma japonicum TaxID=6182 RepID=A0A4Z2CZN9_SCHJA|nr:Spermatogenesis-associated protein [Schistosoma japonicum]